MNKMVIQLYKENHVLGVQQLWCQVHVGMGYESLFECVEGNYVAGGICHKHLLFSHIPPFYLHNYPCVDHMIYIILSPFYFPYHSDIPPYPCLSHSNLISLLSQIISLLSYASIFCLIHTASYLFDYLCTSYILTYCSMFRSLPIGHSTPLISWHCSSLSFLLSPKYSLCSYW